MPAWFRTCVVEGRSLFVELLDNGCLIMQPPRDALTADDLSWVDEQVMPELRHERSVYNRRVREHLDRVRNYRASST
jgi:hypothetical protein